MAYCKGCGKLIVWTRMQSGKALPCDPELIPFLAGPGKDTFITPDGETMHGYRYGTISEAGKAENQKIGYVPHWATCQKMNQFKSKG
jgi:hypothetical protein